MLTRFGYGDHPVLYDHIKQHKCRRLLEIGVADGDNAKRMVEAATENYPPEQVEYYGFDVFASNLVGNQEKDPQLEKIRRKLSETGCQFHLFKGDSTETLPKKIDQLPTMDLIFIDGGHDYPTVKSDWNHAKKLMDPDTLVFFHNANFQGPQRMIKEISRSQYSVKLIDPPSDSPMAKVFLKK